MTGNDLDLTVVGWVGNDPRYYPGQEGHVAYTQFRLGSTRRVFDREQGIYTDSSTEWFTVKVFRAAATNVAESVRRGDPVLVHGRLQFEDWESADGSTRTTPVLIAAALGHDLSRGTTRFVRTVRTVGAQGADLSRVLDDGAGADEDENGREEGHDPNERPPLDVTGAAVLDDGAAVRLSR